MTIISVAILQDGLIISLPPPHRHHHIIRMMADAGFPTPIKGEQGFISSKGNYVDRHLAGQIAIADGQIDCLRWPPQLYSEDLW